MRVIALISASLLAVACQNPLSSGNDAGTAEGGAGADGGTTSTPDAVGADCTQVSTSVSLCAAISICPNTMLNPNTFPHCGYRIHGDVLDLECWCSGNLCPIGVAASCDDIPRIVEDQTEDTVCAQLDFGRCSSLSAGSSSSSGGTPTSCNPTCTAGCGNTPECLQACGC